MALCQSLQKWQFPLPVYWTFLELRSWCQEEKSTHGRSIRRTATVHGTQSWLGANQQSTSKCHSHAWAIWKSKSHCPLFPPVWGIRNGFSESLLLKSEQKLWHVQTPLEERLFIVMTYLQVIIFYLGNWLDYVQL